MERIDVEQEDFDFSSVTVKEEFDLSSVTVKEEPFEESEVEPFETKFLNAETIEEYIKQEEIEIVDVSGSNDLPGNWIVKHSPKTLDVKQEGKQQRKRKQKMCDCHPPEPISLCAKRKSDLNSNTVFVTHKLKPAKECNIMDRKAETTPFEEVNIVNVKEESKPAEELNIVAEEEQFKPVEKPIHKKRCDRKNFCSFCKLNVGSLKRHLLRRHRHEDELVYYCSLTGNDTDSKMKKDKIMEQIRLKGNYIYSEIVAKNGERDPAGLIPIHRHKPGVQRSAQDFVACKMCLGVFGKRKFAQHARKCVRKTLVDSEEDFNESELHNLPYLKVFGKILYGASETTNEEFEEEIFPAILKDDVGNAAISDPLIVGIASDYYLGPRGKSSKYTCTKKMRDAARLLLKMKAKDPTVTRLSDCIQCEKVDSLLVEISDLLEKSNVEVKGMRRRMSWVVRKSALKLISDSSTKKAITKNDPRTVRKEVEAFLKMFKTKWKQFITKNSMKGKKQFDKIESFKNEKFSANTLRYSNDKNPEEPTLYRRWSKEARILVFNTFKSFILNNKEPGLTLSRKLIIEEPLLADKTAVQVNAMVANWNKGRVKLPVDETS